MLMLHKMTHNSLLVPLLILIKQGQKISTLPYTKLFKFIWPSCSKYIIVIQMELSEMLTKLLTNSDGLDWCSFAEQQSIARQPKGMVCRMLPAGVWQKCLPAPCDGYFGFSHQHLTAAFASGNRHQLLPTNRGGCCQQPLSEVLQVAFPSTVCEQRCDHHLAAVIISLFLQFWPVVVRSVCLQYLITSRVCQQCFCVLPTKAGLQTLWSGICRHLFTVATAMSVYSARQNTLS